MTKHARDRAVVLGAGIAGLLAARVLSERYQEVLVIDRDRLGGKEQRRPCALDFSGSIAGRAASFGPLP